VSSARLLNGPYACRRRRPVTEASAYWCVMAGWGATFTVAGRNTEVGRPGPKQGEPVRRGEPGYIFRVVFVEEGWQEGVDCAEDAGKGSAGAPKDAGLGRGESARGGSARARYVGGGVGQQPPRRAGDGAGGRWRGRAAQAAKSKPSRRWSARPPCHHFCQDPTRDGVAVGQQPGVRRSAAGGRTEGDPVFSGYRRRGRRQPAGGRCARWMAPKWQQGRTRKTPTRGRGTVWKRKGW